MQNIYQICDLGRALGHSNVNGSQQRSLFTDACAMMLSTGVPPPGCYTTSVRYDLIVNIRKTSPIRCLIMIDI